MIVLPLTPEPAPAPAPAMPPKKAVEPSSVKVLVLGFSPAERKLLDGVVALSRRRTPAIELLEPQQLEQAHIVMIDAADSDALAWAALQPSLAEKTVIWVDPAQAVRDGHLATRRPVQWPLLPALLGQAIERGVEHRLASVRAGLASKPLSVF
ncbi:MAG: hypothetical protein ACK4MJ_01000 [Hylemonella sp.]